MPLFIEPFERFARVAEDPREPALPVWGWCPGWQRPGGPPGF